VTAWSPEQIANRLRLAFPEDESMRISHEAIYQALYVQGRGALKRELGPCVAPTDPELTAGVSTVAGLSPDATCARLLGAQPVTITITWNTGQTTTLSGNSVNSIVGVNLVSTTTGTVTAGLFAADTFVHTAVYTGTDLLLCLAGLGTVSSLFGQITLEIVAP
jgi:hypothetical protein